MQRLLRAKTASRPRRFAILLFPGFPMMAFSAVIEPLRAANALGAAPPYSWHTVAGHGRSVVSSSGIAIAADFRVADDPPADDIVVCSGGDADQIRAAAPLAWIRRRLRGGANIGSVADGAFYLARAGLLDGFACTLHWRSQPAFAEAFPEIALQRSIYVIDRSRFTSAGGVGAFDMMLEIIGRQQGEALARGVAEWFVHDRIRAEADRERLQLRVCSGIRDDLVLRAVGRLEERIEGGITMAQLARDLGVTPSRLERAFRAELDHGPGAHFRQLRLQRAQDLLRHSSLPVQEIALACGYGDAPAFVRAFRRATGTTPGQVRR